MIVLNSLSLHDWARRDVSRVTLLSLRSVDRCQSLTVLMASRRSDFHALLTKRGGAQASLAALRPFVSRRRRSAPSASDRGAAGGAHAAHRRHRRILFSEALVAEGAVVFAKACELGLEGIVSKRARSVYKSGRSRNWLTMKNPDFVRT